MAARKNPLLNEHVPTEATRGLVRFATAAGANQATIATAMGINDRTLRRHYQAEIDTGAAAVHTRVSAGIAHLASKVGPGCGPRELTAAIFYAKTQMGWRETNNIEHSGPGGGPIQAVGIVTNDPVEAARVYQQMVNGG